MCEICTKWENREIDSKEAMRLIGIKLQSGRGPGKNHAMSLASKILDQEVPFKETDKTAEKAFWKRTHRREREKP